MVTDGSMSDADMFDRAFADLGSRRKQTPEYHDPERLQHTWQGSPEPVQWALRPQWHRDRLAVLSDPETRHMGVLLAAAAADGNRAWLGRHYRREDVLPVESGWDDPEPGTEPAHVLTWERDPQWMHQVIAHRREQEHGHPTLEPEGPSTLEGNLTRIDAARSTPDGRQFPPLFQRAQSREGSVPRPGRRADGEWVIESPPTPGDLMWTDFAAHLWDRVSRDDTRLLVIDDTGDDATTLGLPWSRADYRHAVHLLDDMAWFGRCSILLMPRDPEPWLDYARFAVRADGGIGGGRMP